MGLPGKMQRFPWKVFDPCWWFAFVLGFCFGETSRTWFFFCFMLKPEKKNWPNPWKKHPASIEKNELSFPTASKCSREESWFYDLLGVSNFCAFKKNTSFTWEMYQENLWKICFTKLSTSFIVCLSREAWKALLLENGIQVINLNCFPPPRLFSGLNKLASKQTQFFF